MVATLTAAQARLRLPAGAPPIDASDDRFDTTWLTEAVKRHDETFARYRGEVAATATEIETVRPVGVSDRLLLRWPKVISITSITVDGTALPSASYYPEDGIVVRTSGCWRHQSLVVATYVHGFGEVVTDPDPDDPDSGAPADLKDSCAWFVALKAQSERTGAAARSVRASGPDFTSYVRADWAGGRPTGWDEVDDIWNSYPDLRMPGIG